jgi:hypothetical protein
MAEFPFYIISMKIRKDDKLRAFPDTVKKNIQKNMLQPEDKSIQKDCQGRRVS